MVKNPIVPFSSQLPFSLAEGGGLTLFNDANDLLLEDWSEDILSKVNFSSRKEAVLWLLVVRPLLPLRRWQAILAEIVSRSVIGKEELLFLYHTQSPEVREDDPFLTISSMWKLKTKEGAMKQLFSKKELLALAEEVVSISPNDLKMFIGGGGWYYHSEEVPFSEKFLTYWYKKSGERFDRMNGKLASLTAIALYKKNKAATTLTEIIERVTTLVATDSESHGIPRYVWLMYQCVAQEVDGKKKKVLNQKVVDTLVQIITQALDPRGSRVWVYGAKTLMSFFLEDQSIPQGDREQILLRIQDKCNEIADTYLRFTDEAWRSLTKEEL